MNYKYGLHHFSKRCFRSGMNKRYVSISVNDDLVSAFDLLEDRGDVLCGENIILSFIYQAFQTLGSNEQRQKLVSWSSQHRFSPVPPSDCRAQMLLYILNAHAHTHAQASRPALQTTQLASRVNGQRQPKVARPTSLALLPRPEIITFT